MLASADVAGEEQKQQQQQQQERQQEQPQEPQESQEQETPAKFQILIPLWMLEKRNQQLTAWDLLQIATRAGTTDQVARARRTDQAAPAGPDQATRAGPEHQAAPAGPDQAAASQSAGPAGAAPDQHQDQHQHQHHYQHQNQSQQAARPATQTVSRSRSRTRSSSPLGRWNPLPPQASFT